MAGTYTFELPEIDHGHTISYLLTVTTSEARAILDAEPSQVIHLQDGTYVELNEDGTSFVHGGGPGADPTFESPDVFAAMSLIIRHEADPDSINRLR